MGGGHELVTLHLGSYACFVGAHFWNLQDELLGQAQGEQWGALAACADQGLLYSEGLDKQGREVWRPRALFADVSGALGGVRPFEVGPAAPQLGAGGAAAVSSWQGGVAVHQAPAVGRSAWVEQLELQQRREEQREKRRRQRERQPRLLRGVEEDEEDAYEREYEEEAQALRHAAAALSGLGGAPTGPGPPMASGQQQGVNYWTDYLKVVLEPRSVLTLPGVWHGVHEMSGWGDGRAAVQAAPDVREELGERVRQLVEACDSLQGFQVFAEDLSGWGFITHHLLQEVRDEFGGSGRPVVLFSTRQHPLPVPGAGGGRGASAGGKATAETAFARARQLLNEGIAMASMCHDVAQLYVPLCVPLQPPEPPGGLAHLRWPWPGAAGPAAAAFATSAVLASALDTALLPLRLTGAATPLGVASGGVNLHSLCNLLVGVQRGCPLAGLAAAMPAPALQLPGHQAQQQGDARLQRPAAGPGGDAAAPAPGANAGLGAAGEEINSAVGPEQLSSLSSLTSLTPGVGAEPEDAQAQSLCARGARAAPAGGPASTSDAQAALDQLLRRSGRLCVTHRAAAPVPLLVPLPFPWGLWAPSVGPAGLITRPAAAAAAVAPPQPGLAAGGDVVSVPVVTKLFASAQFEQAATQVAAEFGRACGSSAGRTLLDRWEVDGSTARELGEGLQALAALYRDDDDDADGL